MPKTKTLYQLYWSPKRHVRMLTRRKTCELSHPERLVLSYLVYKARDHSGVKTKTLVSRLGLDERTVRHAIRRLEKSKMVEKGEKGHCIVSPEMAQLPG